MIYERWTRGNPEAQIFQPRNRAVEFSSAIVILHDNESCGGNRTAQRDPEALEKLLALLESGEHDRLSRPLPANRYQRVVDLQQANRALRDLDFSGFSRDSARARSPSKFSALT
jgi:hypothetical protein